MLNNKKLIDKIIRKIQILQAKHIDYYTYMIILSIAVGVISAFAAMTLKTTIHLLRNFLVSESKTDFNYLIIIYPVIGILLTVLFKKYIVKDSLSKHNISSILYGISKKNSILPKHKTFSSILGAGLTVGFGGSVGLEAPIVSSGAAIGSNIGRALQLNYKSVTTLLACGAAGGISAIFLTPIAGVIFAFEVLLIDLSRFTLLPLLLSSISGTITSRVLFNNKIIFQDNIITPFMGQDIPFYIIMAVVTGLVAFYFTSVSMYFEKKIPKIKNTYLKIIVGGILVGLMIFFLPPLFGEGFDSIKQILSGNAQNILSNSMFSDFKSNTYIIILFFTLLILVKAFASSLTVNAGGIGGMFAPSLFVGAIAGFLFAFVVNKLDIGIQLSLTNFSLVGMAGMLCGVFHAPLTAVFLIAEITSGYELLVPLLLTSSISYITIRSIQPNSIITSQLAIKGKLITHHKDKAIITMMKLDTMVEYDFTPLHPENTLKDVVSILSISQKTIFPVIDFSNTFLGILSVNDIKSVMFHQELQETKTVQQLMVPAEATVTIKESMSIVMKKFDLTNASHLPVLYNGKFVGFVSRTNVLTNYRQKLVDISED